MEIVAYGVQADELPVIEPAFAATLANVRDWLAGRTGENFLLPPAGSA
ncbi:hypothetical protein OG946_19360 [Streptomyces sp. NBC_01808]|nr:hypothetical protein [Streptomyces sp. NBC_01808]WSA39327.1 hypothetical protein OG946_19360 [Streptomyces sp. NBC_01808]